MTAVTICNSCGSEYERTASQIRKQDRVCLPCHRVKDTEWRARRKAEGRPVLGTRMPPEWSREYEKKRQADPAVLKRKAARMRAYVRDPLLRPKHRARWLLRRAIAAGHIQRQPCEICGAPKTDAHHDDYTKPLAVSWLCREHHIAHHAAIKARAQESGHE